MSSHGADNEEIWEDYEKAIISDARLESIRKQAIAVKWPLDKVGRDKFEGLLLQLKKLAMTEASPTALEMAENDNLFLIDEIHTPDSSRFWQLASYGERFKKGEEPEYFDKEFLRMWFKDHCDPNKDEKLPEAPAELVEELSRR